MASSIKLSVLALAAAVVTACGSNPSVTSGTGSASSATLIVNYAT